MCGVYWWKVWCWDLARSYNFSFFQDRKEQAASQDPEAQNKPRSGKILVESNQGRTQDSEEGDRAAGASSQCYWDEIMLIKCELMLDKLDKLVSEFLH